MVECNRSVSISLLMHWDYILYKLLSSLANVRVSHNYLTVLNIFHNFNLTLQSFQFGYHYEKYIYVKINKKSYIKLICRNIFGGEHYYFCNKLKNVWQCWTFSSMYGPTLISLLQWFQFGHHYEKHICPMIDNTALNISPFWKKAVGENIIIFAINW